MMHQEAAFIFPGQGSQSLGMVKPFIKTHPQIVNRVFGEASEALGYDLLALIEEGPETELNKTAMTQPALLATSYLIWQCWLEEGGAVPKKFAGHSLGEYSAFVCGNAMSFSEGLRLVALRGALMQEAVPEGKGAMAAIVGLEDEEVKMLCDSLKEKGVVVPANYNAPGQVVISGETAAVEAAVLLAKEKGAKLAKVLAVSVPSHSPLMKSAAKELAKEIQTLSLKLPEVPVVHNVSGKVATSVEEIKQNLIEQLYQPVLWVSTIQNLLNDRLQTFFECGPGKVLTGLCKRIHPSIRPIPLSEPEFIEIAIHEQVEGVRE